jgi:acyl-CoA thioester hydrolase
LPRPAPALLDPARFPFSCTVEPRFGDLDANLHVNNAAMAVIIEEGRVRFHLASGFVDAAEGLTSLVASLGIEYLGQTYYRAPLVLHLGIASLGRTSYVLEELICQEDRPVVHASTVMVCTHPSGTVAIPGRLRDLATGWMVKP